MRRAAQVVLRTPVRSPRVLPLVPDRWADFEELFGARGACGGCWCMTPRLSRREYEAGKGDGNRRTMKDLVESGRVPGVLAYEGSRPIGWCSIEPREELPLLGRSRILTPVDDRPVWSIVCFFVARDCRGRGVSVALAEGAVAWAASQGAEVIEAYPVEPRTSPAPAVFVYTGLASTFRQAGFHEVARRSPTRPILRRDVGPATR